MHDCDRRVAERQPGAGAQKLLGSVSAHGQQSELQHPWTFGPGYLGKSQMSETLKILVVDDEPDVIKLIKMELEREQEFEVLFTCDGQAALEQARSEQPHLILLDVMMPGLSGFETCKALKQDDSTASIPVVMLTVRNDAAAIAQAFDVGAVNYIMKPIRFPTLAAQLKTTIEKTLEAS